MFDFNNKTFKVIRNDGPGAEVTTETVFRFRQQGNIVHADYEGGLVRYGKLLGVLDGDKLNHRYIQVNLNGEFNSGHASDEVKLTPQGKIQLIDSWQWESQAGQGFCIMEEV